ncbi:hypothetical protein E3Q14_03842 [Wallemia mellicola]|nr:hypothetical protein E3Q14_03842 [Wallemia mellicola]
MEVVAVLNCLRYYYHIFIAFSKFANVFRGKFSKTKDEDYVGNEHISSPELVYHTNKSMVNLLDVQTPHHNTKSRGKKKARNSLTLESPPRSRAKSMIGSQQITQMGSMSQYRGYHPIQDGEPCGHGIKSEVRSPRKSLHSGFNSKHKPRRRAFTIDDDDIPPVPPLPAIYTNTHAY